MRKSLITLVSVLPFISAGTVNSVQLDSRAPDPCVSIAGKKWVSPKEVRACYRSIPVDETEKANIIEVIQKSSAFHTSVNYQIRAPPPFQNDVHEDLLLDLERIKRQKYASDYDLHVDISRTLKRLNDGHCVWTNNCYDSLFTNYLPLPLTLLTANDGSQSVHIAPEAFNVSSVEFPDQIQYWQDALPGSLKGKLDTLSGAKVLLINGRPPFDSVNANTLIAGSYQAFGTRQNGFFSSYRRTATEWSYLLGNFAQQSLPLDDSVILTIQRPNRLLPDTIVLPYRSRISTTAKPFTDAKSWRELNCKALPGTNGVDVYAANARIIDSPASQFVQQPKIPDVVARKHLLNVLVDTEPLSNVVLPITLQPALSPVSGSRTSAQFYMARDGKTGILALGSFSDTSFSSFLQSLLDGLISLKSQGASQLIVDVTNNGGGFICAAHWLHRIIAGPKSTTVPQAGLDTKARAGPLAQLIVKNIALNNSDPNMELLYHPANWRNAQHELFGQNEDWLSPAVPTIVNGRKDAFSQRLGTECSTEDFPSAPPDAALFDPRKVAIVSNGRCGSSCSLFSITMSKYEGSKTVVVGGKKDVPQQYCGVVGGQSSNFVTMDTEIKTTSLKGHALAPPDLLVNGAFSITWRLAFGIDNPLEPEEWQNHPADLNLPLTAALANNPVAIWEEVAKRVF